jgi:hypothetical protein
LIALGGADRDDSKCQHTITGTCADNQLVGTQALFETAAQGCGEPSFDAALAVPVKIIEAGWSGFLCVVGGRVW